MDPADIRYARTKDGVRIAYAVYSGDGPPTLNIPPPIAPPLSIVHRVGSLAGSLDSLFACRKWARFDFRGVGFSDPPGDVLTLDHQVADIAAVTDAIGEEMDVFASYSSCFPALAYAASNPPLWRSLVLVAPGLVGQEYARIPLWEARHNIGITIDEVGWYMMLLRESYDAPGGEAAELARLWRDALPLRSAHLHLDAAAASNLEPLAPQVQLPVLAITHGFYHRHSADLAELLPRCSFISTDPFFFNAETGQWLREVIDEFRARAIDGHSAPPDGPAIAAQLDGSALSLRECEVLERIAAGLSNVEIAEDLVLSARTVERHVQNIYNKLGVHNRVEAANWAREQGVI